jgi:hypothetical protein
VGSARGSGGGSLVCYLLNITGLDPIKYNLLFERFLSEERCIDCNIRVITKYKLKAIKDVVLGEEILTENGLEPVSNKINNKVNEFIEIETSNNSKIICSKNHKWPVIRNKQRIIVCAEDLQENDELIEKNNKKEMFKL